MLSCMSVCLCVCIYVCMYVSMYVYVCMYIEVCPFWLPRYISMITPLTTGMEYMGGGGEGGRGFGLFV